MTSSDRPLLNLVRSFGWGIALALAFAAVAFTMAACTGGSSDQATAPAEGTTAPTASVDQAVVDAADSTVIDVRTPAEFAEGHLEGAVNIDVQAADFADRIADLDADGTYIVYCRSGNRSAQAAAAMQRAGITGVTDAGGLDSAAAVTGLDVVK